MGYIYKITNIITGHAYIGYSINVDNRWSDHKSGRGSLLVFRAIQKYGLDNIRFEVLAEDTVDNENLYIQKYNTMSPHGYNIAEGGGIPPSRKGWTPSPATLAKRSASLKGIPRTAQWKERLSNSKQGTNNPMYGTRLPCTNERRLAILRGKNESNYQLYKTAIELLNTGKSPDKVALQLNIGRGVCFRLKNRTHGIFQVFPELI